MAESVLRLLKEGTPDTRMVGASHNIHIQKALITYGGADGTPQKLAGGEAGMTKDQPRGGSLTAW